MSRTAFKQSTLKAPASKKNKVSKNAKQKRPKSRNR